MWGNPSSTWPGLSWFHKWCVFFADIQPQTCISSLDNPFTSACTPAKGVKASSQPDNQTFESSQVVWLTEPKLAAIPTNPIIRLSNFRQLTPNSASFKVITCNLKFLLHQILCAFTSISRVVHLFREVFWVKLLLKNSSSAFHRNFAFVSAMRYLIWLRLANWGAFTPYFLDCSS